MNDVSIDRRWLVLAVYLLGGLALGLVNPQLRRGVEQLGIRPGFGTAANVNVLLPLLAISLAVAWPRLLTVWLGTLGMTAAFVVGLALVHPQLPAWNIVALLSSIPPVLVVACLGYALLGSVTALVTQSVWK